MVYSDWNLIQLVQLSCSYQGNNQQKYMDRQYINPSSVSHSPRIIQRASEVMSFDMISNIIKHITSHRYQEAYRLCTEQQYHNLFYNIIRICYEHNLICYIINSSDKILRIKYQQTLLTQGGLSRFQALVHYRQYSQKAKQNYQNINSSIKSLITSSHFNPSIPTLNNELKEIKKSLNDVFLEIKRLKFKQSSNYKEQNGSQCKYYIQKLIEAIGSNLYSYNFANKPLRQIFQSVISQLNQILKNYKNQILLMNNKLAKQVLDSQTLLQSITAKDKQLEDIKVLINDKAELVEQLSGKLKVTEMQNLGLQSQISLRQHKQENFKDEVSTLSIQNKQLKQQLKQLKSKINQLIQSEADQKRQNQKKLQVIQFQCTILRQKVKKQNIQFEEQIKYQKMKNNDLNNALSHAKQTIAKKQLQVKDLQLNCHNLFKEKQLFVNDYLNIKQQFEKHTSITDQKQQIIEKYQELTNHYESAEEQINRLRNLLELYEEKNSLHQKKIQEYQIEIGQIIERLQQAKKEKQCFLTTNDEEKQKIATLQENIELLQAQRDYYSAKIQSLNLENKLENNDKSINTIVTLEDLTQIQAKLIQFNRLQHEYQLKLQQIVQLKNQNQSIYKERNPYKQSQLSRSKSATVIGMQNGLRSSSYFVGKALDDNQEGRQYLLNLLQTHLKKPIRKTRLIYQMDILNKVNVHKYVDYVENIVLLIKNKNGWVIGGYSEGCYEPKLVSNKDGLIISISGKKHFELRVKNKKAITYDDFFLIFGNSQIRIKSQDNRLFSNFGITNSYYDPGGSKVGIITGEENLRQVPVQEMQVHQLIFY